MRNGESERMYSVVAVCSAERTTERTNVREQTERVAGGWHKWRAVNPCTHRLDCHANIWRDKFYGQRVILGDVIGFLHSTSGRPSIVQCAPHPGVCCCCYTTGQMLKGPQPKKALERRAEGEEKEGKSAYQLPRRTTQWILYGQ